MAGPQHQLLGQMLIAQGMLSEDQLRIALREQSKSHQPIGKLLVALGFVSEHSLREVLSERLGARSIDLSKTIIDPLVLRLIPQALASRYGLIPLAFDPHQQRLTLAMSDTHNLVALDKVRALLPASSDIEALLASESDIERAIDQHYGYELSIDGIIHAIEHGGVDSRAMVESQQYSQPVVRLIEAILTDAVKSEASDIHFEPEASFLRIRYRIDGMLRQIRVLHKSCWPAMVVRIKVMSDMNIAETRAPQDGHIALSLNGRHVDFRVAVQPTVYGENIVLRILDRRKGIVSLENLGLSQLHLEQLRRMMARPEGLILVTGPTGSGKTTTLYSILNHINSEHINIMTLEDPVEYPMPLIRQTSIADSGKVDFASGIRSIMRQDPDVILVGEIRDADTADMAMRAAMTGHQVYSTLHSNSAVGAIPRLREIGVLPEILAGNIIGIVAQRLIRRLCENCKIAYQADEKECRLLGVRPMAPLTLFRPGACEQCDAQGYRGRQAIMEILRINAEMDELIARRATPGEILSVAREGGGYCALVEDGVRRVLDGSSSLSEVRRVIDLSERI